MRYVISVVLIAWLTSWLLHERKIARKKLLLIEMRERYNSTAAHVNIEDSYGR